MKELAGKAAIITGASRGIGEAAAKDLASHGVSVVLAARTKVDIERIADEINASGGKAIACACDVSNYDDVRQMVGACQDSFSRLDILVNNAGLIEPIARLADSDPEHWSRIVDINFKGVYYGLRAAIPVMEQQGSGVIVNLSSGAATGALEGWSHYCSTKAAVLSLTRCADKEYGDKGIRVVGFSPGTVATEMQVVIRASGINPVSQLDPSVHKSPQIVARAITWLCTDDAADLAGVDFSIKDEESRRRAGLE